MTDRQSQQRKPKSDKGVARVELGENASDNYKARLVKGLLEVDLGEGYIVEVINFRSKRVLRRELFDTSEEAREELAHVRDDIDRMSTDDFRKKYLKPPPE